MIKEMLIFFLFCFFSSCKSRNNQNQPPANADDPVISVKSEDEEMNAAVQKARESFPEFLRVFNKADSLADDGFSVKMEFTYGEDNGEHMWLTSPFFRKDTLFGILDNDPLYVTGVQAGDTIKINSEMVSDWIYFNNDTLKGGFTLRVLYKYANANDKQIMEEAYGDAIREYYCRFCIRTYSYNFS